MAATCPNKNTKEWKDLVNVLGAENYAYRAYQANNYEIPAIDSQFVKDIKEKPLLKTTDENVILENDQAEFYKGNDSGMNYNRLTHVIDDSFTSRDQDKNTDFGTKVANRRWLYGEVDKNKKLFDPYTKELETYDQCVARINAEKEKASIAGRIIHAFLEATINPLRVYDVEKKVSKLLDSIGESRGGKFWNRVRFAENEEIKQRLFKNVGLNFYDKLTKEDEIYKDVAYSEVTVASQLLKMATTIDMLISHADGSWSIIDWKTGASFDSQQFDTNILLKYGETPSIDVEDTQRNKAKLEVMLRALMLKIQNPEIQFKNLLVTWIPDAYSAFQRDSDQYVEVTAFLSMLRNFFQDKEAMKKMGLDENIYQLILEKSPNAFRASDYSSNITHNIVKEIVEKQKEPKTVLQDKLNQLQYIVVRTEDFDKIDKTDAAKIESLQKEILSMLSDEELALTQDKQIMDDIGILEMAFSGYGDQTNPLLRTWIQFKREQKFAQEQKVKEIINGFDERLRKVKEEVQHEKRFFKTPLGSIIDYKEFYSFALVQEEVEGLPYKRERLLHNDEKDAELKTRWELLSPAKKDFLNYTNEVIKSYFVGTDAFVNQTATYNRANGNAVSHMDLFNSNKRGFGFEYYNGWFFKAPLTEQEIRKRNGGMFSKKAIKLKTLYAMTKFTENNYTIHQQNYYRYIPFQFMGSSRLEAESLYTVDLEQMFKSGIEAMEHKRYMDPVLQLGNTLRYYFQMQKNEDNPDESIYKNTAEFMRVKLIHDVVGSYVRQKFLSKKLRLPIFTPDGWKDEPLDLEEIIRAMMNWVSMTIMWFKPLQGAGNGIHGMLLTHRDALKGNISKLGINGVKHDDVDFELKDIVRAEAEYTSYIKHAAMGQIMQNKMFLMARHMNYFGNNFDYATMEKTRIVKSMRHLSPNTYYMFHSMPEEFISMTTMAAQLMHIKVGDTGKSLWDFYEVKETTQGSGNYDIVYTGPIRGVVKSGTEVVNGVNAAVYTQLRGLSVREIQRMKRVHERLQGGYRREEAAYIEAYVLGKFFIQLKKYFPRLIINAVHSLKYDNDLGKYVQEFNIDGTPKLREVKDENGNITKEPIWVWQARVVQGRWITLAKMIAYYMTVGHSDSAYSWNRLLPEQKQNIIEAATTLMFYAQFYGAYLLLFGGIDDDDWAKKWWKMYLVGNLSQQYNPMDLAQSLKTIFTPVAAAKMFQTADGVVSLLHGTMGYALTGDESMMYTQDGKIRGLNNVLKQIPFAAQINDYKNRFENSADMADYFDNLRLK